MDVRNGGSATGPPTPEDRRDHRWYYRRGRRVWPHEILGFILRERRTADEPTLAEFWGPPRDAEEESMLPRPTASAGLCTLEPLPSGGIHPADSRGYSTAICKSSSFE